jgi:predicted ATPase/class 3 adenylate cyclase
MTSRALPTGTVTFLFSDMEASTRLVQDLGPATFAHILGQHNAILREAVARHDGVERGTQGDSFLVMFREAPAAVAASADAQVALDKAAWAGDAAVRVRMGLHTGIGTLGGDDYVGVDVNRAARIAALAHGGQVLLSDATRGLVEDNLPSGASLRPLGEFELRDLTRPERLHQLVIDGLRSTFPRLRTVDRSPGNLPDHGSSFIGRDAALRELESLLGGSRLLTLTGPGGTGKTRLAQELARRVADRFEHGAWLVPLDAIDDPALVLPAIASSLSLVESTATTPARQLAGYLGDREMLLVLDNFEQVVEAARDIAELLNGSPRLRVVVTSRAPLRLSDEQEYPVAPLAVPDLTGAPADALANESVRLFAERAGRVRPGYTVSSEEAPAVAAICRSLDGLPLGIELAASRVRLFPPEAIAERLKRQLDVPGGGPRDLPARQQTLEQAIAWSYDLLDQPARRLLARLSVFAGGFRIDESEAVAGSQDELGVEFMQGLSTLADNSLVQPTAGPDLPRFRLLETIRRFAATRLEAGGDAATVARRHASAYLALAEEAAPHMPSRDQVPWLDRLSTEHDNLRAAMAWALDGGEAEIAHRLLAAMWRFWQFRGHLAEGSARATEVLQMAGADAPTTWRMRAIEAAGGLAWWGSGVEAADAFYQSQLEVARALGDEQGIADALFNLLHTQFSLAPDPAVVVGMRAEAEDLYRRLGDERSLTRLNWSAGYALMAQGQYAEAEQLARETLTRSLALEDEYYLALAATASAGIAIVKGDLDEAFTQGLRGLQANHAMGDIASLTLSLRSAALLLFMAGLPGDAAIVLAAYEAQRRRYGVQPPLDVENWLGVGNLVEEMEASAKSGAFAEEARRGARMSTDGVIEFLSTEAEPRFRAARSRGAA